MTAIVGTRTEQRTKYALPGLLLPGLGHLVPWVVTFRAKWRAQRTLKKFHGKNTSEARACIAKAEDAAALTFKRTGNTEICRLASR